MNLKNCDFNITAGNQESTRCTQMGDLQLKLKDSLRENKIITLLDVRYIPSFVGNLFSISTAMTKGAEIRFKNKQIKVQKGDATFEF